MLTWVVACLGSTQSRYCSERNDRSRFVASLTLTLLLHYVNGGVDEVLELKVRLVLRVQSA